MLRTLAALTLLATGASAQSISLTPAPPGARTITVTGRGEATAPADHALIRFQVATEGQTLDEALALHETEVARVRELLRDAGVPDDRVTLDRVSVGDDEERSGFGMNNSAGGEVVRVRRAITADVQDLLTVDELVAALASRTGDDVLTTQMRTVGVTFERREVSVLRETALRDAVRDARRRADLTAEASGVRVSRVLSVTEAGVTGTIFAAAAAFPGASQIAAMMGGMMDGGSGEHTEAAQVVVVYEVE